MIMFTSNRKFNFPIGTALFAVLSVLLLSGLVGVRDLRAQLPEALEDDDFLPVNENRLELGRALFFDPVLSGNQNISCGTCHSHKHGSGDGLVLPVGEGGIGLGPERTVGKGESMIEVRVPRNSQSLFNLGARQITQLFFDGRVSIDDYYETGFNTPAKEDLPPGLENLIAAQAMFPVTSDVEMAGEFGENEVANAANRAHEYVWPVLEERLRAIPAYLELFRAAYPDITNSSDITMVHAANALADFQMFEWRADDSPFDAYLRGDNNALTPEQKQGMDLFYGDAGCSGCHSGALQSDFQFHSIAMPQIGWVRTRLFDSTARDPGRMNQTDRLEDRNRFRTPSLRNIVATAPYGHSGAYPDLESIIRHHMNPVESLLAYNRELVELPEHPVQSKLDFIIMDYATEFEAIVRSNDLSPFELSDEQIDRLIDFMHALTDETSLYGRLGPPDSVPSGLPVDK